MPYDTESNIRAPVILNLLNSLRKRDKMSSKSAFDLFSLTRLTLYDYARLHKGIFINIILNYIHTYN